MTITTAELIQQLAKEHGIAPDQLGADIYRTAKFIEDGGNKGLTKRDILLRQAIDPEAPVEYILEDAYRDILEGIMFFNNARDWVKGWYVRKNPNWREAFLIKFGGYGGQAVVAATAELEAMRAESQAKLDIEAARPKRDRATFSQGHFEEFTSQQIAYRAAVAEVLHRRYQRMANRLYETGERRDHYITYLAWVWKAEYRAMLDELLYRMKGEPVPRGSKRKDSKAAWDFGEATKYLDAGTAHFFSPAFQEQIVESAEEPDLRVDFEKLPKMALAESPVRYLADRDVITKFMHLLSDDFQKDAFEYEDTKLIMEQLRRMLARRLGEKVEQPVTISKGDDE
jgi:hypothetical protein